MRGPTVIATGALLGLLGVAAGAFGTHGLAGKVDARALDLWRTAAHYHQLHAIVVVVIGVLLSGADSRALRWGAFAFLAGIAVFCGTLYAMGLGAPRVLGAVTPVGGLCLMAGWVGLAAEALRRRAR